jgi:hypothetical protein
MGLFVAVARIGRYVAAANALRLSPGIRTPGARAQIARKAGIILLANDIYA